MEWFVPVYTVLGNNVFTKNRLVPLKNCDTVKDIIQNLKISHKLRCYYMSNINYEYISKIFLKHTLSPFSLLASTNIFIFNYVTMSNIFCLNAATTK